MQVKASSELVGACGGDWMLLAATAPPETATAEIDPAEIDPPNLKKINLKNIIC